MGVLGSWVVGGTVDGTTSKTLTVDGAGPSPPPAASLPSTARSSLGVYSSVPVLLGAVQAPTRRANINRPRLGIGAHHAPRPAPHRRPPRQRRLTYRTQRSGNSGTAPASTLVCRYPLLFLTLLGSLSSSAVCVPTRHGGWRDGVGGTDADRCDGVLLDKRHAVGRRGPRGLTRLGDCCAQVPVRCRVRAVEPGQV